MSEGGWEGFGGSWFPPGALLRPIPSQGCQGEDGAPPLWITAWSIPGVAVLAFAKGEGGGGGSIHRLWAVTWGCPLRSPQQDQLLPGVLLTNSRPEAAAALHGEPPSLLPWLCLDVYV